MIGDGMELIENVKPTVKTASPHPSVASKTGDYMGLGDSPCPWIV